MANSIYDRTLAFAGLCQAVTLVQKIATEGSCDQQAFDTSINAIIETNPSNTLGVFGSEEQLQIGLECLVRDFENTPSGSELTRYLISIMSLEYKLSAKNENLSTLGQRIETIQRQLDHFDINDEQMLSNIASIYLEVVSPMGPRIQVTGTPSILQQTLCQHKVRALLLSGIRCSVLWRQVGGKKRHLIFGRKKMVEQAKIILARN
ncbi:MAG: high frequency lysogenization protein HflD [Aliivibrio sp.]|uniref:high frequency lysogenization protein HflD n=1 Tax=Aliivibrio sp. TaxID=1872443 RepID=UPI001A405BED|nr:high frequency lysogenization protein HflD [Aliivibrio sp.]